MINIQENEPLGLKPLKIHNFHRLIQLGEAINRFISAEMTIPSVWIEEYNNLVKVTNLTKTNSSSTNKINELSDDEEIFIPHCGLVINKKQVLLSLQMDRKYQLETYTFVLRVCKDSWKLNSKDSAWRDSQYAKQVLIRIEVAEIKIKESNEALRFIDRTLKPV